MRWWLVTLLALIGVWLVAALALVAVGRRCAARELVAFVPNLVRLFRGLLTDPRVPAGSKVVLGVAVVWLISPIDLIPEFIPVAGPLDDVIVALLALRHVMRRAGGEPVRDHWRVDGRSLDLLLRLAGRGADASQS